MKAKEFRGLALAACLLCSGAAHSAFLPTLTFKDRVGTVSSTATIDVWMTLSLAPDSDSLTIDPSLGFPAGFSSYLYPTFFMSEATEFASFDSVQGTLLTGCNLFFSGDCTFDAHYSFEMNQGPDTFLGVGGNERFHMAAGESRDFLFGSFVPLAGAAAPGDYLFAGPAFGISFSGKDAEGADVLGLRFFASACSFGDSPGNCAFTRTVVSDVPLPAAALLFLSGLGLLGGATRMRRRCAGDA